MGLYVSTVSVNVAISELGITLVHPVTDYRLDSQFNGDEIGNAASLTSAIAAGTLTWRKTAGGTIETAASYDADYIRIEQLNTGTQIAIDPAQVNNFASTVRSVVLTGIDLTTNAVISATDTILSGFGKLQKQITDHFGVGGSTHPAVTTSVNGFMISTDKSKLDAMYLLKMTANQSNTSNTTAVSLSELTQNCVVGKSYSFIIKLQFSAAATNTGVAISLNGTAAGNLAATSYMPLSSTGGTANAFSGPITSFTTYITSTGVGVAGTRYLIEIRGNFICTTAGTFFPIFRSEVNNSTVTIYSGSIMECSEI